jgi:hypothetical protein
LIDDKFVAYVKEEFPRDPPRAPLDSFLFSSSNILIIPHTSRQHSLEGDFSLETENGPVKEEIPIVGKYEEAQPINESQRFNTKYS